MRRFYHLGRGFFIPLCFMMAQPAAAVSIAGHGQISMAGSIIDTACAIATGSREQYIDLGDIPVEQIIRDGKGPTRPFSIHLVNCVLTRADPTRPNWETFQVTFEGQRLDAYFGVTGSASGIALKITDADGNVVIPGRSLEKKNILPDEMRLNYFITTVASGRKLRPGDYSSLIKFKLDYF